MTCSEPKCGRKVHAKGQCSQHYHASRYIPVSHVCPMCGPFASPGGPSICPTCDMTAGEHAYRLRIMADSIAVYAAEADAYRRSR